MKLSYLIIFIFSLLLFSCGKGKIESGEIEYEITYPYNNVSNLMQMMLPKKMTVVFKGSKMIATIKKGKMFTTQIVSDENAKSLEMRLDFGSDVLKTFLTPEDVKDLIASQPHYTFSDVASGDSLVGCSTKNYIVDCKSDTLDPFESVFTTDFTTQNAAWFTSYSEIPGMPLNYLIDRYGVIMQVNAVSFTPREVKDKEFEPTEDYEEVPYKKYDKKVQDLFDVMMD